MNKYKEKMKDMTCEDMYATMSNRMTAALMMHGDMADYFSFLGMHGFKRVHEYQYLSESMGRNRLHHKYIDIHNKIIPDNFDIAEKVEVIPKDWIKYTRADIDDSVTPKFVRHAMEIYRDWEKETVEMYSCIYCMMIEHMCVPDAELVKEYIDDVQHELKKIHRLIEELQDTGYDTVYMIEMQKNIHDKYKKKIREIKAK